MKIDEVNISFMRFMIILLFYFLVFGWTGWSIRGFIDGKEYKRGYADGYQSRVDYEHGK